ncbi:MAG: ScyD/ScyE family protein, partial [Isosphaeraceae bacterium]
MSLNRFPHHAATLLLGAALWAFAGDSFAQTVSTVMTGLDNPRGLTLGPDGELYVVEAGRGGKGPSVFARGEIRSYGPSGAVTWLWHGKQERVVKGLPSHIGQVSGEVTGPHDISMLGRGQAYVTIGLGFDPTLRPAMGPVGERFGRLARIFPNAQWSLEEDFGAYEIQVNPDGVPLLNSNPYGLRVLPGRRIVVEAGCNALVEIPSGGGMTTLTVFPPRSNPLFPGFGPPMMEAVPTAVAIGPDGAFYVGQLTGFPFPAGSARVFRLTPGGVPETYLDGFKTIIDLDFGPDGSLYVL